MDATLSQYLAALANHDWFYVYADDHRAYQKGQQEHDALMAMARHVDPELSLYLSSIPETLKAYA